LSAKAPEIESSCADSPDRASAASQSPDPRSQEFVELQTSIEELKNDNVKSKLIATV
jgi:hypothetical protein